jgi:phage FluMu protein Com
MSAAIPQVLSDSLNHGWLDVECPNCKTRNRIGVSCPAEGKPCRSCGTQLDFWAAWAEEDYAEEMRAELRWYWSQQF